MMVEVTEVVIETPDGPVEIEEVVIATPVETADDMQPEGQLSDDTRSKAGD
jgi:hypothetical protein